MWNDLRPLGTLYTNVRVSSRTVTYASHWAMITGVRDFRTNKSGEFSQWWRGSSYYPNIFEHVRSESGLPQEKVQILAGTGAMVDFHHNFHPGFGEDTWPMFNGYKWPDSLRYINLLDILDTYEPSLTMVNLHEVDIRGHKTTYEEYVVGIVNADSLMFDLWNWIQSSDYYRDRTALIITTDHGRHSDDVETGYMDHGCNCQGCQRAFILGLGAGIESDQIIDRNVDLVDLGATMGILLDVETPFATGLPLSEMLTEDKPGSGILPMEQFPDLDGVHGKVMVNI